MTKYLLTGDIRHAGRVAVEADTPDEAVRKAAEGEFEVFDEMHRCLAFDHNGEEPTVEEF